MSSLHCNSECIGMLDVTAYTAILSSYRERIAQSASCGLTMNNIDIEPAEFVQVIHNGRGYCYYTGIWRAPRSVPLRSTECALPSVRSARNCFDLERRKMSFFPYSKLRRATESTVKSVEVPVYCICRMPELANIGLSALAVRSGRLGGGPKFSG